MACTSEPEDLDGEESSENKEYNPKLDFFSEAFDPLLVLRTPNIVVPVSNATTHDNISKYKSTVERKSQPQNRKIIELENEPQPGGSGERRWLPHQLPIKTERTFTRRNVFTKMEAMEGPLKLLTQCKDEHLRIKIWTRHSHDIRGYCLAYLLAYDKHWNLAVEDVEEVWTRPKRRKVPALDSAQQRFFKREVRPPPVTIIATTKKTETCSRHVDQLLVRGEQIALIAVVDTKKIPIN